MDNFAGMRVIESPHALEKTSQPAREHKRRRWMRESYHARIQKKWLKRFSVVMKPAIFRVSPAAIGMPGADYFVCHPAVIPQIRAALASRASNAKT